jgi:DNA-binding transcriptional LysR family regulator
MSQIEQYLIFGQAARIGSFSRTAEHLGVSNSHVSKHIARLEKALGYKLFHRSPRLQLTEAGLTLLPVAQSMIASYEALTTMAPGLKGEAVGVVRISLPPLLSREIVMPRLADFLREHQGLQLELTLQQSTLQAFSDNLDLVVTLGSLPDSALICQRIGDCETVLVATPRYLALHGTPNEPMELKQHHCMASQYPSFDASMPWVLMKGNERQSVEVESRIATNDIYGIKSLVQNDFGIGVMLKFFVEKELQSGGLVTVLADYQFPEKPPIFIVYHDRELVPMSVALVKEFLISTIRETIRVRP